MADLSLEWDDDFVIDATGDLLVVDGDVEVRQRLERRLFTAVKGYVWAPSYGAGLPQKIGSVLSVSQIKSIVAAQLALEASVAPSPPAQLTVSASPNQPDLITISILYWDAQTGVSVSFDITPDQRTRQAIAAGSTGWVFPEVDPGPPVTSGNSLDFSFPGDSQYLPLI